MNCILRRLTIQRSRYALRSDTNIDDTVLIPQTGVLVEMGKIPRPKTSVKPDWNAGELRNCDTDAYYVSRKAVGRLFRDIKMPDPPVFPPGNLMPAFRRILDAVAESGPPPPRQWPEKPTAEQRLHPSNYPPLPAPGARPPFVSSGRLHKNKNVPATTTNIVRNGSANNGFQQNGNSPTHSHNPFPGDPLVPPGLGVPLGPPPGLGYAAEPSLPLGLQPPPGSRRSDAGSTAPVDYDPDAEIERITHHLRALASPYANIDSTSKETKEVVQLAYGRYVIELQHVSVAVALAENLTEEEVGSRHRVSQSTFLIAMNFLQLIAGTIIAKCQQTRRRRQLKERMNINVRSVVLQLRRSITGEDEEIAPPLHERLLRAFAGYFVAARDAEENVWGAASMCFVSFGVFCDTLEALQKNDVELAGRLGEEVEASGIDELAQDDGE